MDDTFTLFDARVQQELEEEEAQGQERVEPSALSSTYYRRPEGSTTQGGGGGGVHTDYYLMNEDFRRKVARHHKPSSGLGSIGKQQPPRGGKDRGGGIADEVEEDDAEDRTSPFHRHAALLRQDDDWGGSSSSVVQLNFKLPPPPFVYSGRDFPPPPPPPQEAALTTPSASMLQGGARGDDYAKKASSIFFWMRGAEAEGDVGTSHSSAASSSSSIVLPCVSLHCSLMVAASKGSDALRELHQLQAVERRNRETMDTSASSLTTLLQTSSQSPGALIRQSMTKKHIHSSSLSQQHPEDLLYAGRAASDPDDDDDNNNNNNNKSNNDNIAKIRLNTEKWQSIQESRRQLPIFQCRQELLRLIGENSVTIIVGETGSGKTTQLVQYLYEAGYVPPPPSGNAEDEGDADDEEGGGKEEGPRGAAGEGPLGPPKPNKRRRNCLIGCTQPRRLAAVGVARRVSEEMNCALGSTVGYSIHLDDTTSSSTRIKFMTDGVLLREVVQDPDVRAYKVIVLDEAHERSMDTDVLMGTLKAAVARRGGDLKLIVTSATMDVEKFKRFFFGAPSYHVPGRMFEVKEVYAGEPVTDYVAEAVFRVCQLHLQMPLTGGVVQGKEEKGEGVAAAAKHDILVFMSGKDDVMGTCELIHRRLTELQPHARRTLLILPCLSEGGASLSVKALAATPATNTSQLVGVLDPTPAGFRKCVVATNVAETSLTIDGVRYVIDAGFMKTNVYRPGMGMNTLQRYPVSKAQAGQRRGRAGRTAAGVCYRLYTEQQWEREMLDQSVPEIQRSSMDSVVLLLKSVLRGKPPSSSSSPSLINSNSSKREERVRRPRFFSAASAYTNQTLRQFDFMDPPPVTSIQHSMWTLWMMGFLDDEGEITEEGTQALAFPMSPALAKLVLEGAREGCLLEICHVVAMLSADPKLLFEVPKGREEVAQQQHSRFMVPLSDHLTYYNVLKQYLEQGGAYQHGQLAQRLQKLSRGGTRHKNNTNNSNNNKSTFAAASSSSPRLTREWVKSHYLHLPTLLRAGDMLDQLLEKVQRQGLFAHKPKAKEEEEAVAPGAVMDVVRRCLAHSFFLQSARRSGSNWSEYRPLLHAGILSQIHPGSSVCRQVEMPAYVIYNDLLSLSVTQSKPSGNGGHQRNNNNNNNNNNGSNKDAFEVVSQNKEYLMVVTAVHPQWLVEASHGVFEFNNPNSAFAPSAAVEKRWTPSTTATPYASARAAVPSSSSAGTGALNAVREEPKASSSAPAAAAGAGCTSRPAGGGGGGFFGLGANVGMKRRRNI